MKNIDPRTIASLEGLFKGSADIFASALDQAPAGIFITDAQGKCIFTNQIWQKLTGLSCEEALGDGWQRALHPEDREIVRSHWQIAINEGAEFSLDYRYVNVATKETFWISGKSAPVKMSGQDAPSMYIGAVYDITAKKFSEEHQQTILAFLDSVIENIPNMIFIKEAKELRFVKFNKAGETLLGFDRSQLLGRNDYDFFPVEQADAFIRKDREVLRSGALCLIEEEPIETAHNGKRFLRTRKIPLMNKLGEPEFLVGISEDVTEEKQAREHREQARQSAEETTRLKAQFLANMSHEIRTPMNGIIGMTELVLGTNLSGEQRDYVETIGVSARSLLIILNDILDYSKIESGKMTIANVVFDVRKALDEVSNLLHAKVIEKEIIYSVDVESAVPVCLIGDPSRFKQILTNLVGNSVKFTPPGGSIVVNLAVSRCSVGRVELKCDVIDSGIGIPADKQKIIFEPFSQVDPSSMRSYGGTGLGLAIVSQLVDLLGGKLSLSSELGQGTTFTFTAVFNSAYDSVDLISKQAETVKPSTGATFDSGHKPRVLLVEDNEINRKLAVKILEIAGCSVAVATNGEEAVSSQRQEDFDVILMDIQMPGMDGIIATKTIRAEEQQAGRKKVPIMAMTSHAMNGDREKFLAAGMDDYLSKPFSRVELIDKIVTLCPKGKG